ncbi:MAG: hypothetical protein H0V73_02770, partial [Chloroflexi bacterium]|nr:hypothetical protein [Chloroflexota bacterium]
MIGLRRTTLGWLAVVACLVAVPTVLAVGRLGGASTATSPTAIPAVRNSLAAERSPVSSASSSSSSNGPTPSSSPTPSSAPTASVPMPSSVPVPSADPGGAIVPAIQGLVPGSVNATSMSLTADYDVTVRLDFGTRSFRVSSTMSVVNTSGKAIDRLELNTIAARLGGMRITLARADGHDVHPTVSDQTIHLPLGGILQPGAQVTVRVNYSATLRSTLTGSNWLFTRANGILEAHRWLPWISRPTTFDRPNHGDPFVTPVSPRVRVTIVSDRAIRWATTGEQVAGSGLTKTYEARNVRDFAFTGAPDYRLTSATIDGVIIHVWARPGFPAATVMSAAKTALSREA